MYKGRACGHRLRCDLYTSPVALAQGILARLCAVTTSPNWLLTVSLVLVIGLVLIACQSRLLDVQTSASGQRKTDEQRHGIFDVLVRACGKPRRSVDCTTSKVTGP